MAIKTFLTNNDKVELLERIDKVVAGDVELSQYAKVEDIPTSTSELTNDSGFITADDMPESANIKKKFSAPDGDYIATHLTVGASGVSNSTGCIMTGGRSYTEYYSGDLVAAKPHLLENASNTAIVGGMDNNIAYADGSADLSVILGGLSNQIQAKSSCIVCGENNTIAPHNHRSVIIGGKDNEIPFGNSYDKGFCGVILGGIGNIGNTGEVVMGKYNNDEESDIENALIIGNGSSATMRSNALRVTYNGEIYTSAGYGQEEKKIATEEYVNNLISTLEARIAALEA